MGRGVKEEVGKEEEAAKAFPFLHLPQHKTGRVDPVLERVLAREGERVGSAKEDGREEEEEEEEPKQEEEKQARMVVNEEKG